MTRTPIRLATTALGLLWLWLALAAPALGGESATPPYVDAAGAHAYRQFDKESEHRAFAVAPGGTWGWVAGKDTAEIAEAEALAACRQYTEQRCRLYDADGQVLFNAQTKATWATSWDLYFDAATIAAAPIGTGRGTRFPDLALTTPDGQPTTLAALRGKPVFLHFWGSWCPPCQFEFKDLQKLYDTFAVDHAVTFVLVQSREDIAKARRWSDKRGFTMPLYDSGHQGRTAKSFRLGDDTQVDHRRLASIYPTTYVLDADGLVVFHKAGPGENWAQYESLLRHLVPAPH